MAGIADVITSPWPHGELFPIQLGPIDFIAEDADPGAVASSASFKTLFAFNVKRAYLWMRTASFVSGVGMDFTVEDDTGTPQVIIANRAITTSDDAGAWIDLTVADEGPILYDAEIFLQFDPGDTAGEVRDLTVLLWVSPLYAPVPGGTT